MRAELLGCGQTAEGQLGTRIPDPSIIRVPDRIVTAPNDADGTSVQSVACGESHTLFLTSEGKIWSVGSNVDGQLGRGNRNDGSFSIYPVSLTIGVPIIQISAGRAHSLAVAEDGRAFAWGSNEHGQLGMESQIQWRESPKRISELTEVVQVAAGASHGIALTGSGSVFVWGEQADGRCLHSPQLVDALIGIPIVRVFAGARHCVAVSASGAVFTWGQNNSGELGTDDLKPHTSVHHVHQMDGLGVVEAACGDTHTVLLTNCGRTFSFGSDALGQCGFGKKIEKRTNPTAVSDLIGSRVTRIAAGACHTLAVIKGCVYPFGLNSFGQLGNGKISTQSTPRKTDELDRVTSVFAGYHQTFFIRSQATIEQHEIVGPNCPVKYPLKINRQIFEDVVKSGEKLDVIGLLESVFSSLSCINNSFLYSDERRFEVGVDRGHGIDLDDVMETFLLIDESPNKKQYVELIIESFMMALQSWNPKVQGVESLRIFFIMPWLSFFTENVTLDTIRRVHRPFLQSMCSICEFYGAVVERWWSQLNLRHFRRLVTVFKTAVKMFVVAKKKPIDCQEFLHCLQKLFLINKTYHIIPLETFYIEELNTVIHPGQDYYLMIKNNGPTEERNNFWTAYPYLLNGIAKGELLQAEALMTREVRYSQDILNALLGGPEAKLDLYVTRENIVRDAMALMAQVTTEDLQMPLKVHIQGEEADDAGGVRKEFFLIVMRKVLQPDYGMFLENPESHLVWFSGFPPAYCDLEHFRQMGRLVGCAVYNQTIVPFPFPLALYKYLLHQLPTLDDLCELSPTEGRGLQSLLEYEENDVEDVFALNFTITFDVLGTPHTVELVPGGENKPVTNENRDEFVREYVRHRLELGLNNEIAKQAVAFRDGFSDALHSRILRYFQPCELQELVCGNENYDWSQLREVCVYKEKYSADHPAIQTFWRAFFSLTDEEKKKFLHFLSGSTRLPVAGMSKLGMAIQPSAPESLPVAHTCFNLLDLPDITDEQEMLRRLRISIEHIEGFTLV